MKKEFIDPFLYNAPRIDLHGYDRTGAVAMTKMFIDENEKIDDVVLLAYKGPKSFTGEDSVEIICHGSPLIYKQIIAVQYSILVTFKFEVIKNSSLVINVF